MSKLILHIGFVFLSLATFAQQRKNLHSNWLFNKVGEDKVYPAQVPGTVHQDLMNNKLIEDIYFENNEINYRWIEEEDWQYVSTFQVNQEILGQDHHVLVFEGLDTYAEVYLNNVQILSANNMFRTWKVDVHKELKLGSNELKVVFTSPIRKNKEKFTNAAYELPAGCENVEIKVGPYTRKAAYHFGWDWGPRIVTSGIWRDVYLDYGSSNKIKDVYVTTEKITRDSAWLKFEIDLSIEQGNGDMGKLSIELKELGVKTSLQDIKEGKMTIRKRISKPKLWWPNGWGEAHLYLDQVKLFRGNRALASKAIRYGIRTIELVHEPDSIGTAFYFKVNGQPIFIKGANYIPQDMLLPRVSDGKYRSLLMQAQKANMNMLRVWGGGIYESDLFYDLCDELGLMVWQDFMFAGSMYPGDTQFLDNVANEVRDNVERIRGHPSLAIWCGNNEMNVAWHNWGWQKKFGYSSQDSTKIWNDYKNLFHKVIPKILDSYGTEIYVSTSPISNWGTAENFNHSTMHYWGVWHGREPFENFEKNVGRFMVEYGFQSFPEMNTLKKVIDDSNLHLDSEVMKNRQKSYIGNGLIEKHVLQYYKKPANFSEFVDLSQKTQAKGMEMAIQAHRKKMGHCMGTLFWQLNDCWPGPSWSIIDYYGNEKHAYESVKSNYEPVMAIKTDSSVTIISDLGTSYQGFMKFILKRKNGKVKTFEHPIQVEPMSTQYIRMDQLPKIGKQMRRSNFSGFEIEM